jgi:hypothetical protein
MAGITPAVELRSQPRQYAQHCSSLITFQAFLPHTGSWQLRMLHPQHQYPHIAALQPPPTLQQLGSAAAAVLVAAGNRELHLTRMCATLSLAAAFTALVSTAASPSALLRLAAPCGLQGITPTLRQWLLVQGPASMAAAAIHQHYSSPPACLQHLLAIAAAAATRPAYGCSSFWQAWLQPSSASLRFAS